MRPRFSVVIPAHDEAAVIGRTLRFAADLEPGEAEIVVVANGCRDATAATAAAAPGVRVVSLAAASKPEALNAGDAAASSFPRIYLDADIDISAATLRRMSCRLSSEEPRICCPTVSFRTTGRPWPVRAYHRVYAQLPYVRGGLVGGAYGVSASGRRRFGRFPAMTNDDTFVQRLFAPSERVVLAGDTFGVHAPRSLAALLAVRTRVAAGNAQLAATGSAHLSRTTSGTARALLGLLRRRPGLAPAAAVYAGVTLAAELRARRRRVDSAWLRDDSTRSPAEPAALPVAVPALAYLVSLYPALSHEFISREIRALRADGVRVSTFTVRPALPADLTTDAYRRESAGTASLLGSRRALAVGVARFAARHPLALAAGLRQAGRTGPRTARSRLWQLFYLVEAVRLVALMRASGLRHVHVHLANNAADIARLAVLLGSASAPGTPRWTWSLAVHGPTEFADVPGSDLAAKVRSASAVACISDFCRSQLMALVEPEHWGKLGVVRMSVEAARYPSHAAARAARPADRPLRVLFVGRLVPEKGPSLLLSALALLPDGAVQARIVGTGPLGPSLADQVRSLGLPVSLLGGLGQDDLPAQFAWADAFCLPSVAEGLPVVLMEAMASGLPVLTTRIAGIPELVEDGVTGLLVPPGRADRLASALLRLRDDAPLRRALGVRAVMAVHSQHDPAVNAAALRDLLAR